MRVSAGKDGRDILQQNIYRATLGGISIEFFEDEQRNHTGTLDGGTFDLKNVNPKRFIESLMDMRI